MSSTSVADRYEILDKRPYETGGMAQIWRARDSRTGREVALKQLLDTFANDPDMRERFRAEARAMSKLHHRNLVAVYDADASEDGDWMAMEFVPGDTLKRHLEKLGPMSPKELLPILQQLADASSYIHQRDLVHLDIKPHNVILQPDGIPKLVDFGLMQESGKPQESTHKGVAYGSLPYISPEQASGGVVDAQSDVYQLGCCVYELLTGRSPFENYENNQGELIRAQISRKPTAPSQIRPDLELPGWVDDVVGWALAKDRRARYHDAPTFARMFQSGMRGDAIPYADAEWDGYVRSLVMASSDAGYTRTFATDPSLVFETEYEEQPSSPIDVLKPIRWTARTLWHGIWWLATTIWKLLPVQRLIGRLAMVAVLLVFALGGLNAVAENPPEFLEPVFGTYLGGDASVTTRARVRAEPSTDAETLVILDTGTSVEVTGDPREAGNYTWYPIEFSYADESFNGWIYAEGLDTSDLTEQTGTLGSFTNVVDSVTGFVEDTWDTIQP